MSPIKQVILLALPTTFAFYLHEFLPDFKFFPQIIALLAILVTILLKQKNKLLSLSLTASFITLLIATTGNLKSPVFFLWYFMLITLALLTHPLVTFVYTLVVVVLFTQTASSLASFLQLASLVGISPLIWLISLQQQTLTQVQNEEVKEQNDINFWLTLKFKTVIDQNLALIKELSDSKLNSLQQQFLDQLRFNHERLLRSKDQLLKSISKNNTT